MNSVNNSSSVLKFSGQYYPVRSQKFLTASLLTINVDQGVSWGNG